MIDLFHYSPPFPGGIVGPPVPSILGDNVCISIAATRPPISAAATDGRLSCTTFSPVSPERPAASGAGRGGVPGPPVAGGGPPLPPIHPAVLGGTWAASVAGGGAHAAGGGDPAGSGVAGGGGVGGAQEEDAVRAPPLLSVGVLVLRVVHDFLGEASAGGVGDVFAPPSADCLQHRGQHETVPGPFVSAGDQFVSPVAASLPLGVSQQLAGYSGGVPVRLLSSSIDTAASGGRNSSARRMDGPAGGNSCAAGALWGEGQMLPSQQQI